MKPCKFRFDWPEKTYDGFAHGNTWNGFDNVAVTRETLEQICADLQSDTMDNSETIADLRSIEPMADGLISLGWGYATQIVED